MPDDKVPAGDAPAAVCARGRVFPLPAVRETVLARHALGPHRGAPGFDRMTRGAFVGGYSFFLGARLKMSEIWFIGAPSFCRYTRDTSQLGPRNDGMGEEAVCSRRKRTA